MPAECTYCHHVYGTPCNGKDKACANKLHVDAKPAQPTPKKKTKR